MNTQDALKMAIFELDGVIADIKLSGEFDCVSYDTVVRVRKTIADYVAPSWQGLTAKEIASIPLNEYTVQTVERMLKEKNT